MARADRDKVHKDQEVFEGAPRVATGGEDGRCSSRGHLSEALGVDGRPGDRVPPGRLRLGVPIDGGWASTSSVQHLARHGPAMSGEQVEGMFTRIGAGNPVLSTTKRPEGLHRISASVSISPHLKPVA